MLIKLAEDEARFILGMCTTSRRFLDMIEEVAPQLNVEAQRLQLASIAVKVREALSTRVAAQAARPGVGTTATGPGGREADLGLP